ncbi:10629_t:CDS:2 [Funneliformis geosporum]|nr:10629_t:CDS:2 [Funneliformis geosporum]
MDTIEEKFPAPANKHIYIIVAVSAIVLPIAVLFELKKAVIKKHTFQTMAELISADLKSTAEAMALIRHNLTSANNELTELEQSSSERLPEGSEMDIESSSSEEELLPKRHKLRHVIATSNVSSDIAPMEDFFDTMSEEEIFRYKVKQILTRFLVSQSLMD